MKSSILDKLIYGQFLSGKDLAQIASDEMEHPCDAANLSVVDIKIIEIEEDGALCEMIVSTLDGSNRSFRVSVVSSHLGGYEEHLQFEQIAEEVEQREVTEMKWMPKPKEEEDE